MNSLIKALKNPSDPPAENGPNKIEIAQNAWNSPSHLPRKGQVIAEWLLPKLDKDRERTDGHNSSFLAVSYWSLLADIVSVPAAEVETLKSWLLPLLRRVHLSSIVVSYLQCVPNIDVNTLPELNAQIRRCLAVLWPLALRKLSAENLLDSLGALMKVLSSHELGEDICQVGQWITTAFLSSIDNSVSKKKLYLAFCSQHLAYWADLSHRKTTLPHVNSLIEDVRQAGSFLMFHLDILRLAPNPEAERALFDGIARATPSSLLSSIPNVLSFFIQSVKRHRASLIPQSSRATVDTSSLHLSAITIRFYDMCETCITSLEQTTAVWTSRRAMLEVVMQEGLLHVADQPHPFGRISNLILGTLKSGDEVSDLQAKEIATECLSLLFQIDYDVFAPQLESILPVIILSPNVQTGTFLRTLLQHHVKTRTILTHISTLFGAAENLADSQSLLPSLFSEILTVSYLEGLQKAIQSFLPPTQVLEVIQSTLNALKRGLDRLAASRTSTEAAGRMSRPAVAAIKLREQGGIALTARLASQVLRAITQSFTHEVREELQRLINDFYWSELQPALVKSLELIQGENRKATREHQLTLAELLRFHYNFVLGLARLEFDPVPGDILLESFTRLGDWDDIVPELALEIVCRNTLHYAAEGTVLEHEIILERILSYLEKGPSKTVLFSHIIQRWLPILDELLSPAQRARLLGIVLEGPEYAHALSSSQFWELKGIRIAFMSHFEYTTSSLDDSTSQEERPWHGQVSRGLYRTILLVPPEYLNKDLKARLLSRALNFLCSVSVGSEVWPAQTFVAQNLKEGSTGLSTVKLQEVFQRTLEAETSDVSRSSMHALLRSLFFLALSDRSQLRCRDIIHSLQSSLVEQSFANSDISADAFSILVELLSHEFRLEGPDFDFNPLYGHVSGILTPSMPALVQTCPPSEGMLKGWLSALRLGRWLGKSNPHLPLLGVMLATQMWKTLETVQPIDEVIFSLILEELYWLPPERREGHLRSSVLCYTMLSSYPGHQVSSLFGAMCCQLSLDEYSSLLQGTLKRSRSDSVQELGFLAQLSTSLLLDPPRNTLHVTQDFTTQCLITFATHLPLAATTCNASLLQNILTFISRRCCDRSASLRSVDLSNIFSILSKALVPSTVSGKASSFPVFHDIVTIISVMVRHRRDLVLSSLPQLGMLLRRLLSLVRSPRPQLGSKQLSVVVDTFPPWLSVHQPLTIVEVQMLSRLLEALAVKTVLRTHDALAQTRQAESLSTSFSKHASFVLLAYIEAGNDPLCFIPQTVRKELYPGLFALCGMLNDHSRDSMMVSTLDPGGKVMMKALWKEYEKQQYTGQG